MRIPEGAHQAPLIRKPSRRKCYSGPTYGHPVFFSAGGLFRHSRLCSCPELPNLSSVTPGAIRTPILKKQSQHLLYHDLSYFIPPLSLFHLQKKSSMDLPKGSQVGGGPYGLRRTIKVTENASPEARNNAQRRYANSDCFDLPDSFEQEFENVNPFLTGPFHPTGNSSSVPIELDPSVLGLDDDTLRSLTSDALSHYTGSSPLSEPFTQPSTPVSDGDAFQLPSPYNPENLRSVSPGEDAKFDGEQENKENAKPAQGPVGRRPDATRELMEDTFSKVDNHFQQLATTTGLTPQAIHNAWLATHGMTGTRTNWCRYQAYFSQHTEQERMRVKNAEATASQCYKSFKALHNWEEILMTFEDLQGMDTFATVRQR
ncbi:hypothetical protein H0H93_013184 [Arthromyces matolae]|nr:hypothetical protein H0H93_013184 [Arthromyces matolae]